MIECKITVPISCLRVISSKNTFLQYDAFGLQLNGLQEVSEFELNAGQLGDALRDVFVHRPCDLEESVDARTEQLERAFKRSVLVGLLR